MPNRAGGQLITGRIGDHAFRQVRPRMRWCGRQVILPTIPGPDSRATGAIIATRGLDSAVRGIRIGIKRPDLAAIDDPDTEDTAANEEQGKKLERKIDRTIAGLAGQRKTLARVMLTTLQNCTCVSAKFTDPRHKPSWHGKRFRLIETWPDRQDLWDEYVMLRQAGMQSGDEHARKAHAFYLAHREEMDRGAVVSNPERFVPDLLPDGTQKQVSTLQFCYDFIADKGLDAFLTEYQNDPPEETGPQESGITAHRIQKQLSGYPRKVIPPGCILLTQGVDCRKVALHWVIKAWRPDATCFVIDYGVHEVLGTVRGSDEGLDLAMRRAILARADDLAKLHYQTIDGQELKVGLTLVDAGWRTEAVYAACKELGLDWKPSMGFGKSSGTVQANFSAPDRATYDRKPGDGWFLSRRPKGVWLVCMDTDRWKAWEHDRWMTPTDRPGTAMVFGEPSDNPERMSFDEKSHHSFARHITAEVEVEEVIKGILQRKWKAKSENNHWLDASYMANVAANMKGISLLKSAKHPSQPAAGQGGWMASQNRRTA
jgi:hypothetical protein